MPPQRSNSAAAKAAHGRRGRSPSKLSQSRPWDRCLPRREGSQLTGKALALSGLVEQQLREAEVRLHPRFLAFQAFDDLVRADRIPPEHRPAAIDRPAVTVDPHDIDVGRALGDTFLKDLRALVDHRIKGAFDDLLVADLAALNALLPGEVLDDLLDDGRRRRAALLVIIVKARALLLAPSVDRAQRITDVL